ncbi:MAG: sulfotransferase [Rubricoccaceae bacterium]|nr:sulfotransferase [Rubricoccaceae bacterium]
MPDYLRSFRSVPNTLAYHWRRNSWLFDPRRFFSNHEKVEIRKPIFFLGDQGGGLTLIGRMIRRNPSVVSISGDHTYWSGPDEMQRVMELRLPKSLKLSRLPIRVEVKHDHLTAPRSWSYATDELLGAYRKTAADYVPEEADVFRSLIREAIHRFGSNRKDVRFFDKSQVYTVKLSLINEILKDSDPYFVLVTRNPYVACYRAAQGKALDMKRYAEHMSLEERVELCAQHWSNAMDAALNDGGAVKRFTTLRFEDVLASPSKQIQSLCDFLDIEFDDDMLPQPHHRIPFGSRFPDRWYPLRKDVNSRYLEQVPCALLKIIDQRCAETAHALGYERPAALLDEQR